MLPLLLCILSVTNGINKQNKRSLKVRQLLSDDETLPVIEQGHLLVEIKPLDMGWDWSSGLPYYYSIYRIQQCDYYGIPDELQKEFRIIPSDNGNITEGYQHEPFQSDNQILVLPGEVSIYKIPLVMSKAATRVFPKKEGWRVVKVPRRQNKLNNNKWIIELQLF